MTIEDLVSRITTLEPLPGVTVHLYPKPGTKFVHMSACLDAGLWRSDNKTLIYPYLMQAMLDEGTKSRPRDILRLELERLGTEIRFELGAEKMFIKLEGRASAFPKSIEILADMLLNPAFEEKAFAAVKKRLENEYEDDREDTRKVALSGLTGLLFDEGSAHRIPSPDIKIARIRESTAETLRTFASRVLKGNLTFAVVGDVTPDEIKVLFTRHFSVWNAREASTPMLSVVPAKPVNTVLNLNVPSKENVDVYLGWLPSVKVSDPEYIPLSVAIELLGGGGFTGHLMRTVRERDGLTYGIFARLRDTSSSYPLYAFVWATFGNRLFEKGVAASMKEIELWRKSNITKSRLESKKREIVGSYIVSFQDPEEIAMRIISTVAAGLPLSFLADYLRRVHDLDVADLKRIAGLYLQGETAVRAAAGTFE